MKQRELIPMYGICTWHIETKDLGGRAYRFKIENKCYFDRDGNPVADKKIFIVDYNSTCLSRMDICCNPFDNEDVIKVAKKFAGMEDLSGEAIELCDFGIVLFHAVSPSQFYIMSICLNVPEKLIDRDMYKVADNSLEEFIHIHIDDDSHSADGNRILEAVRGTFKSLGYINTQLKDDVIKDFDYVDSYTVRLDNIQDDNERGNIYNCMFFLLGFCSFERNMDMYSTIEDCVLELGSHLPKKYLLKRLAKEIFDDFRFGH